MYFTIVTHCVKTKSSMIPQLKSFYLYMPVCELMPVEMSPEMLGEGMEKP